ncbi:MAG: AI-2E family transporter [Oscillospiraceae bacterium]|nr:AI-2E family transporter [Oscillospiraceae bacterium]
MKRRRREPIVLSQMRPFTLFLVLSGCIFVAFCLINLSQVVLFLRGVLSALSPVIAGLVFAYLLNPVAGWLERRFQKLMGGMIKKSPRLKNIPRVMGSFLAVLLFVGSLTALVIAVFSNVVDGVSTMLTQLPHYVDLIVAKTQRILRADNTVTTYLRQLSERFSATELGMGQVDTVDLTQRILSVLASGAAGTLSVLYTVFIGFIVAVYLLISKERFIRQWKQVLFAVFKPKTAEAIDRHITMANKKFSTAVLGKLVDSLIIGVLCFIGVTIIGAPYSTLIAVIIGVTNVIPYFGPILGAIPCALLILMESPTKALYFAIFIVVLQQFDANILDPKIVGQSIGLPAFWELFACLLGGGLFGITGLIIGVPAFAVIYELLRTIVIRKLSERVRDGEMESEFLTEKLGIQADSLDLAGDIPDREVDSPYVQHLILLEEISEVPEKRNTGQEQK